MALQGEDVEQLGRRVAHVGAGFRATVAGYPEQPEQAHHVVDAQASGMAQRGADRLDERLVAGGAQLPGDERREAPVLAQGVELVGRRTHAHVEGEEVLPGPSVRPPGVEAHGEVLDHRQRRRRRHLPVEQPLEPGVEPHPLAPVGGEMAHRRALGTPELLGPGRPPVAVDLGDGAEGGELLERRPFLGSVGVEGGAAGEPGETAAQSVGLQLPHPAAVDATVVVQRPPGGG